MGATAAPSGADTGLAMKIGRHPDAPAKTVAFEFRMNAFVHICASLILLNPESYLYGINMAPFDGWFKQFHTHGIEI